MARRTQTSARRHAGRLASSTHALASERGIVVEFNLFYVPYGDGPELGKWSLHPLDARNNVNNVGHVPFHRYNTRDKPALVVRQEAVQTPHGVERFRQRIREPNRNFASEIFIGI
jgi:hypothetical protein